MVASLLSLLSCPDHSSAVDHISQVWSLVFVVFTKSYLLSYLLQPIGFLLVTILLDWTRCQMSGKIHGRFFFCMLGCVLPLFPLTNAELMCTFVYCSIYFEFAGIGRPERGGWAWGQDFVRNNKDGKK